METGCHFLINSSSINMLIENKNQESIAKSVTKFVVSLQFLLC